MDLRQNRHISWADRDVTTVEKHVTPVDPRTPWTSLVVWFLAAFELGPDITMGYAGVDTSQPPDAATPDGSWARVGLDTREVTEGGPRRLWRIVESAQQLWERLGRPGWERFGLTVTPKEHVVWLDRPDGECRWAIGDRGPAR